MLTKRIIPCLDVKDGRVVKGVNFVSLRDAGDPVETGEAYSKAGADELVFLDITATSDARNTVADMVRRVERLLILHLTLTRTDLVQLLIRQEVSLLHISRTSMRSLVLNVLQMHQDRQLSI